MRENRIGAIIISAGYSSRMNGFKPLLEFENTTAVERLINTYMCAGIQDIYVVVGYKSEHIIEKLGETEVNLVFNEAFAEGMFTSIKKGVLALDRQIKAFFMQPVDIPLIKADTLERLKKEYNVCGPGVFYPTFYGKRGHPPLVDCRYNTEILNSDDGGGLKKVLERFEEEAFCVPVFDKAILLDMDTKEDYEKLLEYDNSDAAI